MSIDFISANNISMYNPSNEVYIFGAGEYALLVKQFLENNNINIEAFCVDDLFYSNTLIDGIKIVPLSVLGKKTDESFDVFYSVGSPKRLKEFRQSKCLKNIYIVFDPAPLWEYDDMFMRDNKSKFNDTMHLLADDKSRKTMSDFLQAKKTGDAANDMDNCCQDIYFNCLTEYGLTGNGVYIDCGAFDGKNIEQYLEKANGEVYAFEPDENNYNKLVGNFKNNHDVHCFPYGVWSENTRLGFNNTGTMASCIDTNITGETITCVSIDATVKTKKVSFIKMDVEGAELKALVGARNVITRDMPVLAISAYHKIDDLITLPQYISSLVPKGKKYDFYLRHHGCVAAELVLYAIPANDKVK